MAGSKQARSVASRPLAGRLPAVLLLLLIGAPLATVRQGAAVSTIGLLAEMAIKIVPHVVANIADANNVSLPIVINENKLILKRLNDISLQLMDGQTSMVANIQHYTAEVVHMSSIQNRFIERIEDLYALIGVIARRERTMNALLLATDPHEPLTLTQFALGTIDMSNRDSVIELMHRIETLVLGDHLISLPIEKQNIFAQLSEVGVRKGQEYEGSGLPSGGESRKTCNFTRRLQSV